MLLFMHLYVISVVVLNHEDALDQKDADKETGSGDASGNCRPDAPNCRQRRHPEEGGKKDVEAMVAEVEEGARLEGKMRGCRRQCHEACREEEAADFPRTPPRTV